MKNRNRCWPSRTCLGGRVGCRCRQMYVVTRHGPRGLGSYGKLTRPAAMRKGCEFDRFPSHAHLLSDLFHEGPSDGDAVLPRDWNIAMTLLGGSPDLDSSPPALPDASHRAADRDKEPRHQAPAPTGESCLRCKGLLVLSSMASLEWDLTGRPMRLWRCINCGDCVDPHILANRGKGAGSARPRARPPTGHPRTGRPREVGTGMTR